VENTIHNSINSSEHILENDGTHQTSATEESQHTDTTVGSQDIANDDAWNDDPWDELSEQTASDSTTDSTSITSTHDHAVIDNAEQVLESTPMPEQKRVENQDAGVNLAKAALDAQSLVSTIEPIKADSSSVVNNSVEWYNKAVNLLEESRHKEALSCFDAALKGAADDDDFAIRVLNGRGHALYYMEKYGDCIRAYHDAMRIDKTRVSGQSLYNMGTAYAEVQLFEDGIQCFKQAQRRGLSKKEKAMCKEQIRRCTELLKIEKKKIKA
jgi:tetratricopeptide (TPR) repeat protein